MGRVEIEKGACQSGTRRYGCRFAVALVVVVSLACAAPALASRGGARVAMPGCDASAAAAIVSQTNSYRASLGLSRLRVVPKLVSFASFHARDMATSDVLTHSSSSGQTFAQRAHGSSYRFTTMRENVAVQGAPLPSDLGSDLMVLWKASPEHDANMRASDITQIGVAVAPGPSGCYASMDLGSPL